MNKQLLFLSVFIFLCSISFGQSYRITTFAGSGVGDGDSAIRASVGTRYVALDDTGNVYIADEINNRVRKISKNGILSTIAGKGTIGYTGDGGQADSAELNHPDGIVLDASGNIYIADYGNNCIRKINKTGIISTMAGNGYPGFFGDGGLATSGELINPAGLAIDGAGNIYIADAGNNRIRKVNTSDIISTVAGNGTAKFSGDGGVATSAELNHPLSVALDGTGNIFIADSGNNRIRKINSSSIITTIAGNGIASYFGDGGTALSAEINHPEGVAVDASSNIYIADFANNRIRKVNKSGIINTVAGNGIPGYNGDGGLAISAELYNPTAITVDGSGNIYIADYANYRARKVNSTGIISTIAGNGQVYCSGVGCQAVSTKLETANTVAVDNSGNVYITDGAYCLKVSTSGIVSIIAGNGIWGYSGDGGPATSAEIATPFGIAVDNSGNIYLSDYTGNRIRKVNSAGIISTFAGTGVAGFSGDGGPAVSAELNQSAGVSADNLGNVYISDANNGRIRVINTSGYITTIAGGGSGGDGGPAISATLNYPIRTAEDDSGNVYIAEEFGDRIRKINKSGIISTIAGIGTNGYSGDGGPATSAQLYHPIGVAVDLGGNVFVADYWNYRVRMINSSGIISTVAGNGITGYSGDGGLGSAAEISVAYDVAVDKTGNVYVADIDNFRIRILKSIVTGVYNIISPVNSIKIYPNPSNGLFQLAISNEQLVNKITVEVYNVLGQQVYSQLSNFNSQFSIDLENQPSGVYF